MELKVWSPRSVFLILQLVLAFATPAIENPAESRWELVPTIDGTLHLVNTMDPEFQAAKLIRSDFNVRFLLYTRSNPQAAQELETGNPSSLARSHYRADRPTRILIHGWRSSFKDDFARLIRRAYLDRDDLNVIVFDWEEGSSSFNYVAVRYNVPDAAKKLANFMDFLISENGTAADSIYLIGHSLGAHIGGLAGKFAKVKPHTIFGLDAALPLFNIDESDERLAVGDANYVQSIQTDCGRLGFGDPIGEAAFYPAWGDVQPGCGIDFIGSCSHRRAYDYFAESIQSTNDFWGHLCESHSEIKKKLCSRKGRAVMGGEPANPEIVGHFYVKVNSKSPYASGF